ncbi:MAG: prolyl oligopeptidase family serine peptidase [Planctomycetes bacterium]|nr:prolyl oligopeptidase family serine peptidase [Planctomycetota bacterium]
MRAFLSVAALAVLLCLNQSSFSVAQQAAEAPVSIRLADCLVLPAVGGGGRSPVRVDALEAALLRDGFKPPAPGDKMKRHDGTEVAWRSAKVDDDGWLAGDDLAGGYAWWTVPAKVSGIWLLKARGHSGVYVNGELRGGDPYNNGNLTLPVALAAGDNQLLFLMGRGRIRASLELVPADHSGLFVGSDWTLPDLVEGDAYSPPRFLASVDVINATGQSQNVRLHIRGLGNAWLSDQSCTIQALSVQRISFPIAGPGKLTGDQALRIAVCKGDPLKECAVGECSVRVKHSGEPRKVTFISAIDGSVQYYGLLAAKPLGGQTEKPGIALSLHGASVEASGQAAAYSPKSWCHIVCPTNRRPFGFDWEDWGRLDALEVLAHAQATLDHDPRRIWLTGHSMGGHGTWTVGAHFPDKFAAIGPSAGWQSFWTYGGGGGHPEQFKLSPILTRGANASRTLLMKHNYKSQGVYILHGDADDNVPVTEARAMRDALREFHNDLHYHEEPGVGHWWDRGHDAGADCLDWSPMWDLFAKRRLAVPGEVMNIDFTTVCPENSDSCFWASIHMQQVQLEPSRIQLSAEPNHGRISGTTVNVSRLRLDVAKILHARGEVILTLDGDAELAAPWPQDGVLWLQRAGEKWLLTEKPSPKLKGPHRYGLLKNGMTRNVVLVYGTGGSAAENAWMFNKARFDSEQWLVRANGGFTVLADTDFKAERYRDCDLVLYGNETINSGFSLLAQAPLKLLQGKAVIGERELSGADLAMLFCYPRADSDKSSVCVIGGTGLAGMRLTERLPYFVSGAAFPDVILYGPELLELGTGGVRAAGFLGEDWQVASGEIVWRDDK